MVDTKELKKKVKELEKKLEEKREALTSVIDSTSKNTHIIENLREELNEAKTQVKAAEERISVLLEENEVLKQNIGEIEEEKQGLIVIIREAHSQIEKLMAENERATKYISSLKHQKYEQEMLSMTHQDGEESDTSKGSRRPSVNFEPGELEGKIDPITGVFLPKSLLASHDIINDLNQKLVRKEEEFTQLSIERVEQTNQLREKIALLSSENGELKDLVRDMKSTISRMETDNQRDRVLFDSMQKELEDMRSRNMEMDKIQGDQAQSMSRGVSRTSDRITETDMGSSTTPMNFVIAASKDKAEYDKIIEEYEKVVNTLKKRVRKLERGEAGLPEAVSENHKLTKKLKDRDREVAKYKNFASTTEKLHRECIVELDWWRSSHPRITPPESFIASQAARRCVSETLLNDMEHELTLSRNRLYEMSEEVKQKQLEIEEASMIIQKLYAMIENIQEKIDANYAFETETTQTIHQVQEMLRASKKEQVRNRRASVDYGSATFGTGVGLQDSSSEGEYMGPGPSARMMESDRYGRGGYPGSGEMSSYADGMSSPRKTSRRTSRRDRQESQVLRGMKSMFDGLTKVLSNILQAQTQKSSQEGVQISRLLTNG
ncbi:hypothetical protein ADUPG1_011876, partial [Aduncisulcus paluster]